MHAITTIIRHRHRHRHRRVISAAAAALFFFFFLLAAAAGLILPEATGRQGTTPPKAAPTLGIIICDHGSRRQAANDMIYSVRDRFLLRREKEEEAAAVVEVAHMELAEPTIEQAFDACVSRGATTVVCHPFFLSPGRHVTQDIPALMKIAASRHPHVQWTVSDPLGLAPGMPDIMLETIASAIERGDFQSG